jgi:BirA family biotin operon repressor/biotin-[acetyl-CoA-carboxylase] ligase
LPVNLQAILDAPIIQLDTIDSSNNYAMRLADADTAQAGLTIVAVSQTQGKGQRGHNWADNPGDSLLMSIITHPQHGLDRQFVFSATVAVAIANVLQKLSEQCDVRIKWPNDIIINDKKAGGILIENIIRGNNWAYAIVGLGLNVNQHRFPDELPNATSLHLAAGRRFDIDELMNKLRTEVLTLTAQLPSADEIMQQYNDYLYRREAFQTFGNNADEWLAEILHVAADGKLHVRLADGTIAGYTHGSVEWVWGR